MSAPTKNANASNNAKANNNKNPNAKNNEKGKKSRFSVGMFWTAIAILFVLLILSLIVLCIRIGEFSKHDDREVMLKSNMDADLDIFSVIYRNSTGEITVEGVDGEKVIAPGTAVDYTVRLRNKDKIAIDYTLTTEVGFLSEHEIPVNFRLIDPDDNYLAGDAKTWADVKALSNVSHSDTIERGGSAEYIFQWKWPFESGDDAYDTFLGNISDKDVAIKVTFTIHAEANTSLEANGGFWQSGMGRTVLWIIFFILLLIAIILLLLSLIKNKPEPEPEPTPVPVPAPEPKVIPVVVPVAPKPVAPPVERQKGFVGKMAYVNIDTLCEIFENGDVVSLDTLKKMGVIDPKAKQMKLLARNNCELNKALIIETQGISAAARAAILKAGGKVHIVEGDEDSKDLKRLK